MSEFEGLLTRIGENVKRLRQLNKWTQDELANESDRPQSSIARLERASNGDVGLSLLFQLSQAMNVPVSELVATAEGRKVRTRVGDELKSKWERVKAKVDKLPESERDWVADLVDIGLRRI